MGLGNIGLPGLLLIAVVVLVLFGRGKISGMMGEVGKGITSFKRGMEDGRKEIEDGARDVTPPAGAHTSSATTVTSDGTVTTVTPERDRV